MESSIQAVPHLDLGRFMGDWYVIANIPTFFERDAFNPVENYKLNPDGTIAATFSFNHKRGLGQRKTLKMKGIVRSSMNKGVWEMQYLWPIKADYRIAYLDTKYEFTVIARNKRDYLWIMSRSPQVDHWKLQELIGIASDLGYDEGKIRTTSWQNELQEAL